MTNTTANWEIHCKPDAAFTRKYGRKVKAVGGSYGDCRGYAETRYVVIPDSPEGRKVADAVIRDDKENRVLPVAGLTGLVDEATERIVCVHDRGFSWPIGMRGDFAVRYFVRRVITGRKDETKERLFSGVTELLVRPSEQVFIRNSP